MESPTAGDQKQSLVRKCFSVLRKNDRGLLRGGSIFLGLGGVNRSSPGVGKERIRSKALGALSVWFPLQDTMCCPGLLRGR